MFSKKKKGKGLKKKLGGGPRLTGALSGLKLKTTPINKPQDLSPSFKTPKNGSEIDTSKTTLNSL